MHYLVIQAAQLEDGSIIKESDFEKVLYSLGQLPAIHPILNKEQSLSNQLVRWKKAADQQ